jgi:hypothetical protein
LAPVTDAIAINAVGVALTVVGIALTLAAQLSLGNSWRIGVDGAFAVVLSPRTSPCGTCVTEPRSGAGL